MSAFEEKLKEVSKPPTIEDKFKNVLKVQEKVTKKAVTIFSWLPNIFMALLSLLIIGLSELVSANFDPSTFTRAEFWNSYLTFQTAVWILTFNILALGYRLIKRVHKRYIALSKKKNLIVTVDNQTPFIAKNAEESDNARKVRAWKIYQNRKLNKIVIDNGIADLKDFLYEVEQEVVYETKDDETFEKVVNTERERIYKGKKKRIKKKIDKILMVLTNEWIEKNIDGVKRSIFFFRFQYAKVTRDKLVSGGHVIQNNYGEPDFKKHTGTMVFELFLSSALFISVIMFVLLSFRLDPKATTVETIIKILVKAFLLIYNGMMAWFKLDEAFEKTELKVLDETTNELNKYYVKEFNEEQRKEFEKEFDNF